MKRFFIIATLILFFLNIIMLWNYNNLKKTIQEHELLNTTLYSKKIECEQEMSNLSSHIYDNMLINNNKISKEILLKDISNKNLTLKKIISDGEKVIFRIPKEPCSPCIDKILIDLKGNNNFKTENIIIFMSDESLIGQEKYDLTKYGIKSYVTYSDLPIEFEKNQKEYFFSIDKSFLTKDGFIPGESDDEFIHTYLNSVLK